MTAVKIDILSRYLSGQMRFPLFTTFEKAKYAILELYKDKTNVKVLEGEKLPIMTFLTQRITVQYDNGIGYADSGVEGVPDIQYVNVHEEMFALIELPIV